MKSEYEEDKEEREDVELEIVVHDNNLITSSEAESPLVCFNKFLYAGKLAFLCSINRWKSPTFLLKQPKELAIVFISTCRGVSEPFSSIFIM